jgi:hypothetical protein
VEHLGEVLRPDSVPVAAALQVLEVFSLLERVLHDADHLLASGAVGTDSDIGATLR